MKTGTKGVALIQVSEGYEKARPDGSCVAYLDKLAGKKYWSPGYKGLWTIGYGCTEGVTEGMVWTQAQATKRLQVEIAKHEVAVSKMIKKPINQNQFDAIVSLSYNIGSGAVSKSSVVRKFNEGDVAGAADAFLAYNKAGGKVYPGLVTRRAAERKLFLMAPPEDVVDASQKLTWLKRFRVFVTSLGVGSYLSWENLLQVRNFMGDHAGVLALGMGVSLFVIAKLFESRSIDDYEKGRWTPSGMENSQ